MDNLYITLEIKKILLTQISHLIDSLNIYSMLSPAKFSSLSYLSTTNESYMEFFINWLQKYNKGLREHNLHFSKLAVITLKENIKDSDLASQFDQKVKMLERQKDDFYSEMISNIASFDVKKQLMVDEKISEFCNQYLHKNNFLTIDSNQVGGSVLEIGKTRGEGGLDEAGIGGEVGQGVGVKVEQKTSQNVLKRIIAELEKADFNFDSNSSTTGGENGAGHQQQEAQPQLAKLGEFESVERQNKEVQAGGEGTIDQDVSTVKPVNFKSFCSDQSMPSPITSRLSMEPVMRLNFLPRADPLPPNQNQNGLIPVNSRVYQGNLARERYRSPMDSIELYFDRNNPQRRGGGDNN